MSSRRMVHRRAHVRIIDHAIGILINLVAADFFGFDAEDNAVSMTARIGRRYGSDAAWCADRNTKCGAIARGAHHLRKDAADTNLYILGAKTVAGDGDQVARTSARRIDTRNPRGVRGPRRLSKRLPDGGLIPQADAQGILNRPSSID